MKAKPLAKISTRNNQDELEIRVFVWATRREMLIAGGVPRKDWYGKHRCEGVTLSGAGDGALREGGAADVHLHVGCREGTIVHELYHAMCAWERVRSQVYPPLTEEIRASALGSLFEVVKRKLNGHWPDRSGVRRVRRKVQARKRLRRTR